MRKTNLLLHSCVCTACPSERFGYDCREECGNCYQKNACNHINGTCADGCNEGFKGQLCKTRTSTVFRIDRNCALYCTILQSDNSFNSYLNQHLLYFQLAVMANLEMIALTIVQETA